MSPNGSDAAVRPAAHPADTASPPVLPAVVEGWLTELGLRPAERVERDGVAAWDLELDGRRRFDVRVTLILDPALGLISWVHFAPPIGDGLRKSYRTLLRWNDEFPFVKFSLAEDGRPTLSTEIPLRFVDRDELGLALARSLAICDALLPEVRRLALARRPDPRPGRAAAAQRVAPRALRGPAAGAARLVSRAIATRLACLAAAVAIAVPLAVGPIAAAPVAAAGPRLDLVGTTRYLVQPDRHRVHVTVDLIASNRSVETITTRYVYDHANLAVLPGAVGFHASNDGVKVTSSIAARSPSSTLVAIRFAKRLGSGRSTTLRLTFDLPDPGGSPSRQVRVGPSLVAFPVWAFGSRGVAGSSVSVKVPAGYKVTVGAGRLGRPTVAADGTTIITTGSLADPFALSGYVLADRAGAFAETPLDVPVDGGTAHLVLRAWTDDPAWARKTATLLKRALPALSKSIGLPYRPTSPIAIEETVARSIDGLSGIYEPASGTIRIAYTAPPSVVLRSVAHLWFDESLFADRWIVEGLVSQAAAEAALRLDLQADATAAAPTAAGAFPLNAWVADPGRGPDAEASEAYGYAASAELVRLIAARTGADGLRAVLRCRDRPVCEPARRLARAARPARAAGRRRCHRPVADLGRPARGRGPARRPRPRPVQGRRARPRRQRLGAPAIDRRRPGGLAVRPTPRPR